jgi:hypothetical protein
MAIDRSSTTCRGRWNEVNQHPQASRRVVHHVQEDHHYVTCWGALILYDQIPVIVPGPNKEQDEQPEVPGIMNVLQYVDHVQYWLQSHRPPICTDYRWTSSGTIVYNLARMVLRRPRGVRHWGDVRCANKHFRFGIRCKTYLRHSDRCLVGMVYITSNPPGTHGNVWHLNRP